MSLHSKVNIYELAKATGYSISTVSKALNNTGRIGEATRKKIMEKAVEMNYVGNYHAKVLSQKKTWLIAIIYSDNLWSGFSHPYFSVILEHFKRKVEDAGYEVTFINRKTGNREFTYLEFCKYRKVDGVFMVNSYSLSRQIPELIESGIPIVSADAGGLEIPTVTSDDFKGSVLATKYLIGLGHKLIYHISGPLYTVSGQKRKEGFESVMKEQNITDYKILEAPNYGFDDGYELALEICKEDIRPTAVFVAGDWMALGAIKAFEQNGIKVPGDISIIGYDDLEFVKYTNPALTTISQNKEEIGVTCATLLMDKIAKKDISSIKIDVELVERETCRKLEE